MSKAQNEGEFDDKYVTTNLKAGAPRYSADIVRKMYHELLELDQEEFKHYGYAVLTAMFIGAHRGDFVPKMFEETIRGHSDREAVKEIFYLIRECIIAIYAFLGIPWVVPSGLGIVNVLQREGLEDIAQTSFRGPIDSDKLLEEGKKVTKKTYRNVNNSEVRDLLSIGFAEMRKGIAVLIWGYNVGGAAKSGLLLDRQVELLVATAIISSGATRQSRSHVKASLGMGNQFKVVKKIVQMAEEFALWNKSPLNPIDVDKLASEMP